MTGDAVPAAAKADISEAVRKALAKHGYARLTTKKIAAESEKSEAGLYYHYDSKDEMIAAFLETAADYLARELEAADAEGPEAKLRAACDRLFTSHEDEDGRGIDIAMMELLSHAPYNETFREPLLALETGTLDHLTEIIETGVESGLFRDVNPRGTAAFLMSAAHGSTGFYLALEMHDAGGALHEQVEIYLDSLLVDGGQ